MGGIINDVLIVDNVNFDSTSGPPFSGQMTADGQLLIGNALDPKIRVGEIVSSDGSVVVDYVAPNIDLSVATLAPYIVPSTEYPTIQSAINAAVPGGVSDIDQANIYIKAGEYAENLTISGGLNFIAFSAPWRTSGVEYPTVRINGTVTITSGPVRFVNVGFKRTTGDTITLDSGNLILAGCSGTQTAGNFLTFTSSNAKNVTLDNCEFSGDGTSRLMYHALNAPTMQIDVRDSRITDFDLPCGFLSAGGNIAMNIVNSDFYASIYADNPTFNLKVEGSYLIPATTSDFFRSGNSTTGSVEIYNSEIEHNAQYVLNIGSKFFSVGTNNLLCIGSSEPNFNFSLNQVFTSFQYSRDQSNPIFFTSNSDVGWQKSGVYTGQARLMTSGATVEVLSTIPFAEGEGGEVRGTIQGYTSDLSKRMFGRFSCGVYRPIADTLKLLGNPEFYRSPSNSTATFETAPNTTDLEIRVFGEAATAFFWVCEYSYQKFAGST